MATRNLHRLHDYILQIQFLPCLSAPRKTAQPCGFAGICCNLASAAFSKTGISVSGKPQNCPHCGEMWLGWCGKAPAVSPAHFSARRKPSEIPAKPLKIAGAAIRTLLRFHLPTHRLTGSNARLLPALPASAAHGDAQWRSRPDRAGAGCAAPAAFSFCSRS